MDFRQIKSGDNLANFVKLVSIEILLLSSNDLTYADYVANIQWPILLPIYCH